MTESTRTPQAPAEADRELVLERLIDAPRELVFEAFTDPAHLPRWVGPNGFTNLTHEIDVRVGGTWRYLMIAADGKTWDNYITWTEITPLERITYDHGETPAGGPHFYVTVTFAEEGGKTRLTMRSLFPTAAARAEVEKFGAVELGHQTLARLASQIEGRDRAFSVTRTYEAPKALVFQAFTEAERLAKWWGPKGMDLDVMQVDLRPGGIFHYKMTAGENTMWGKFRYLEIAPTDRLVYLSSFSDPDGGLTRAPFPGMDAFPLEVYNVVTFREADGKTTITLTGGAHNASEEEQAFFAGMHDSMQGGFKGTLDQLEAYLATA